MHTNPTAMRAVCSFMVLALLAFAIPAFAADVDENALALFMDNWRDAKAPGGAWDGRTGDMDGDRQLTPDDAQAFLELLLGGGEAMETLESQAAIADVDELNDALNQASGQPFDPAHEQEHMTQAFQQAAAAANAKPATFTSATVYDDFLLVSHANGLQVGWVYTPPHPDVPVDTGAVSTAATGRVGTAAVVGSLTAKFYHVMANDPRFNYDRPHLDHIKAALTTAGFAPGDIEEIQGDNCTVDTFKQMAGKGFVLVNTHGAAWTEGAVDHCLFVTGDVVDVPSEVMPGSAYYTDWEQGRIFPTASCIPGDSRFYWCVTERFFDTYYSAGDFPQSIFYNGACQGLKNEAFANVFAAKGVSCYLAWTESQSQSIITGGKLFTGMDTGSSVADVMASLPASDLHETHFGDAYLQFRPDPSGGATTIKAAAGELRADSLSVTTPTGDQSGDVTINYALTAPTGTQATFQIGWGHRSDPGPNEATIKSVSGGQLEQVGGFYRIKNVGPGNHSFVWDTGTDVPGERRPDARVSMTYCPTPATFSWSKQTDAFAVDNSGGAVDPDVADIEQLFADWAGAFNNLDSESLRNCMHPNYKNLGMNREAGVDLLVAELTEDPSYKLSFTVSDVQVNGNTAGAVYQGRLSGDSGDMEWGEPGQFPILGFDSLVKEDGLWWFYGNQSMYMADAIAAYMRVPGYDFLLPPRYGAQLIVQDPTDYVTGGTVNGPGLTGPETLERMSSSILRGWSKEVDFGGSPVATPATYNFVLSTPAGTAAPQATMESFFTETAQNMSFDKGAKVFSWDSNPHAVSYRVQVYRGLDLDDQIWSGGPKSTPNFPYTGSTPLPAGLNLWIAVMQDANGNISLTGAPYSP